MNQYKRERIYYHRQLSVCRGVTGALGSWRAEGALVVGIHREMRLRNE